MGINKHPTWEGYYVLDIRHGTKERDRINFEGTFEEATTEYWRLKNLKKKIVGRTTLIGDLVGEFLTWYQLEHSPTTVTDFIFAWKQLAPHFGKLHFHQVDTSEVDRYKTSRLSQTYLPGGPKVKDAPGKVRKPISKRTITRELAYLSSFCKWAKEKGYTNYETNIKGFPKKQVKAPIQTTHSFDEVQRILEQTKESKSNGADRYGLALLMYDAGLRKTEARLLTSERVNLPPEPVFLGEGALPYYGSITVVRKGAKEEMLPVLTMRLYTELQARKKLRARGYLYLNPRTMKPYRDIISGLKGAAERAGVTKRTTNHLLRHDFATHLHEGGADLKTIQGLLSHQDIQTTLNIYTHLEHSKMAQMAGGFAAKINGTSNTNEPGQKK